MAKTETAKVKNNTTVLKCSCSHEYQDKKYGAKMRVKNSCGKGFRCTVCGSVS